MTKQIQSIVFAACLAPFLPIGAAVFFDMSTAQAKECSVAMPSNPHGQWWSYRLIDGRKCWYAGKPMLSKSLLEWPTEVLPEPSSRGEAKGVVIAGKPGNPLDAQALALEDFDTFEERWRARISSPKLAHD